FAKQEHELETQSFATHVEDYTDPERRNQSRETLASGCIPQQEAIPVPVHEGVNESILTPAGSSPDPRTNRPGLGLGVSDEPVKIASPLGKLERPHAESSVSPSEDELCRRIWQYLDRGDTVRAYWVALAMEEVNMTPPVGPGLLRLLQTI